MASVLPYTVLFRKQCPAEEQIRLHTAVFETQPLLATQVLSPHPLPSRVHRLSVRGAHTGTVPALAHHSRFLTYEYLPDTTQLQLTNVEAEHPHAKLEGSPNIPFNWTPLC